MQPMYYIGLDVHKRKISYCVQVLPLTRLGEDLSWQSRNRTTRNAGFRCSGTPPEIRVLICFADV